jgi:hypothetical protein
MSMTFVGAIAVRAAAHCAEYNPLQQRRLSRRIFNLSCFPQQIAQLQEVVKSQNANQAMILTLEPSRRML